MVFGGQVAGDIFAASFFLYSISFLLESFWRGSIVQFVDLNILLVVCIVSGILAALLMRPSTHMDTPFLNVSSIFFFSALTGIIIWRYTGEVGNWSIAYGVLSAFLLFYIGRKVV
jgi:hypothetical protein